jgi:hypothetical protein
MSAKLKVNPIQVTNRLDELFGVTKEQLIQVVSAGVSGRNDCTSNHPASMPGTRCWGDATEALRRLFISQEGWRKDDTDNIPSVVNRSRNLKIAVCNTDSNTGIEWGFPQPVRDKGDGALRAGFRNQGVLRPILDDGLNGTQSEGGSFWYLCIFCGADMVRAELLCPVLNEDGSFKDYIERIALVGEDEDGGFRALPEIPESPDGDAGFEISVVRKQVAQ